MKLIPYLCMASIALGCAPSRSTESKTDSVTTRVDTVITVPAKPEVIKTEPEPPIDASQLTSTPEFPMFSTELHSDDAHEQETMDKLISLTEKFESQKFAAVKSTYTHNYQVGNDYDDALEDRYQTETITWYFNAGRQLCAYTQELKSGAPEEEPELKRSTIYLFEDDKLAAVYSDHFSGGQAYLWNYERIVVPRCPDCGVKLTQDGSTSEGTQVTEVDQEYISTLRDAFEDEYDKTRNDLLFAESIAATSEGYTITVQKPWNETSYALVYTVPASLLKKFRDE